MKIRFMCPFSLGLYVFTQTVDLNYNPYYLKKGLSYEQILQCILAKKFNHLSSHIYYNVQLKS